MKHKRRREKKSRKERKARESMRNPKLIEANRQNSYCLQCISDLPNISYQLHTSAIVSRNLMSVLGK